MKTGDILLKIPGKDITMQSIRKLPGEVYKLKVGDTCNVIVRRNRVELEVTQILKQRTDRHIFEDVDELTEDQKILRDAWSKNL